MKTVNRRRGTKYHRKLLKITPERLYELRGRLMAREKRNITWAEFGRMTGVPYQTIKDLLSKRRGGSLMTIDRLLTIRQYGIMIDDTFFTEELEV